MRKYSRCAYAERDTQKDVRQVFEACFRRTKERRGQVYRKGDVVRCVRQVDRQVAGVACGRTVAGRKVSAGNQ